MSKEKIEDLIEVDVIGKNDKTKLGSTISDVFNFVKKFLDVKIKATYINKGLRVEIFITHKLKLTKFPVTQTDAAKILEAVKKGDKRFLAKHPAVKTGRAFKAIRIYNQNQLAAHGTEETTV